MQVDSYLRIYASGRAPMLSSPSDNPSGLLFVDLAEPDFDLDEVITAFQELPHRLSTTTHMLLRWPETLVGGSTASDTSALINTIKEWADTLMSEGDALAHHPLRVGIIAFRVGNAPLVQWAGRSDIAGSDAHILARARSVELRTLIEWANGFWRSRDYHFVLPSGQHADSFIRLADGIRSPRDVEALCSWLAHQIEDNLGIVADSATMTPLILGIRQLADKANVIISGAELLDDYPRTHLDAAHVVRRLAARSSALLGLLSVSASGGMRDLMSHALGEVAPHKWRLEVLVDKRHESEPRWEPEGAEQVSTWWGHPPGALQLFDDDACPSCRDNERAQIVRIDPRTFSGMVLPLPRLVMPSTRAAASSFRFWEAADAAKAIAVQVAPHASAQYSRPKSALMPVRIFFEKLVPAADFLRVLEERAGEVAKSGEFPKGPDLDLILTTPADHTSPGFDGALQVLRRVFGWGNAPVVEMTPGEKAPDVVRGARRVVVFSLGMVTGWTSRQLLIAVHDAWKGIHDNELYGLILHARPETAAEWRHLRNSYRDQLTALWLTYLPWTSPLEQEHKILEEIRQPGVTLSAAADAFLAERREYCQPRVADWPTRVDEWKGAGPRIGSVLWGLAPRGGQRKLRGQSMFGYELSALAAYVAIGNAIHDTRTQTARDAPQRLMFNIPGILRSYYDGLIIACMLRWIEPQEAWWGARRSDAEASMQELIGRTTKPEERKIVLPELLLGAAQGKIPAPAVGVLVDALPALTMGWSENVRAPVEVGVSLIAATSPAGSLKHAPWDPSVGLDSE